MKSFSAALATSCAVFLLSCGQQVTTEVQEGPAAAQRSAPFLSDAGLAPTGTLRAAFLGTNPIQGRVDPATGAVTGPIADLVQELAARLNVPYQITPCPNARCVIDRVNADEADVGFLAYAEARAMEVDYAGPYAMMMSSYLLAADSPLQTSAEADTEGVVIGTVRLRGQEIYLSANLHNAQLVIYDEQPSNEELEALLTSGELSAFGINRQRSTDIANAFPSLHVMNDSFFDVPQEFVVEKGNSRKVDALNGFVDELRASGFLEAALMKANLLDSTEVSPPITH